MFRECGSAFIKLDENRFCGMPTIQNVDISLEKGRMEPVESLLDHS